MIFSNLLSLKIFKQNNFEVYCSGDEGQRSLEEGSVAERLALRIDIRLARVLFHTSPPPPTAAGKSTPLENTRMEFATTGGNIRGKIL